MSYCVNCGVKLAKSEKRCPLCHTKVYNPNVMDKDFELAYSPNVERFKKIDTNYLAKLISVILILLGIIITICDVIFSKKISWSIYVICSIFYLCSHLVFLTNKKIYLSLLVELISLESLLFVIAYLNNGLHWYLYLVFPFIFILWGYVVICTYLIKRKRYNFLRRISLCLLFSAVAIIVIECGIDLYKYSTINLTWSFYTMLPITIISLITFIISFNTKLLDEIKQKIFI